MSKPRLAEILGVDVNEKFKVKGYQDHGEYYIDSSGNLYNDSIPTCSITNMLLTGIISRPEDIIRKPKWTRQDIADAKAVKRLYCNAASYVSIHVVNEDLRWVNVCAMDGTIIGEIASLAFPSIKDGEIVKLDDIINSERSNEQSRI